MYPITRKNYSIHISLFLDLIEAILSGVLLSIEVVLIAF